MLINSLHAGEFGMQFCRLLFFFSKFIFSKNSFRNTISPEIKNMLTLKMLENFVGIFVVYRFFFQNRLLNKILSEIT